MTEATQRTSDSGVSIWLDDLSRTRIESGNLQELIKDKNVVGVTTNPSIFQKALSQVGPYDAQLKELGKVDVETAIRELTTTDVRNATDIFREIAEATDFVDGRVSIEVDPRLAHETEATEQQAVELWEKVNRPNAMIKIPATLEACRQSLQPCQGHLRQRHPDLLARALRAGHRCLHRRHRSG